jgi:formylmethanofuran dehydrogenase subunit E-like metal-binding protein
MLIKINDKQFIKFKNNTIEADPFENDFSKIERKVTQTKHQIEMNYLFKNDQFNIITEYSSSEKVEFLNQFYQNFSNQKVVSKYKHLLINDLRLFVSF